MRTMWLCLVLVVVGCGGGGSGGPRTTGSADGATLAMDVPAGVSDPGVVADLGVGAVEDDAPIAEDVAAPEDVPATPTACLTPCDCPADSPVCAGSQCTAKAATCLSDWGCGCGEVCQDGACAPPPAADTLWCMWACECPAGLPWCGGNSHCQAKPPTAEEQQELPWQACLCGWDLDPMGAGCYPTGDTACDASAGCNAGFWHCDQGTCAFGVPASCAADGDCPPNMACDPGAHVCAEKEGL